MAIEESFLGAVRLRSVAPPAHYILNIQQFSLLTKQNVERYESNEFEASGYKWKLVIHPNGNKSKNVGEFLSAYIAMADSNSVPLGWEVYATFRIFLLDQNIDNYIILEDEMSEGRRFHGLRTEWGFDKFVSLKELGDSNNGYLVGDKCVFGAEVFLSKETSKCKTECLSMVKDAVSYKHTWKIDCTKSPCEPSNIFYVESHKWEIMLHIDVDDVSLKLVLADLENLPSGTKILAEFTLCMRDQLSTRHKKVKASNWFSASEPEWGWQRFISLALFVKWFLVKDVFFIEADVAIHGERKVFT